MRTRTEEEALYDFYEQQSEMFYRILGEFRSGEHEKQPWTVVPAGKLKRVWEDFSRRGRVYDTVALAQIEQQMRENAFRLQFNNIVSGHESVGIDYILDDAEDGEERMSEEEREKLADWAVDLPTGGWRISDYGMPKINEALVLAAEAKTPEAKLKYLDRALNVCHQRSDLAEWFVQGGRQTLSQMAGEVEACVN